MRKLATIMLVAGITISAAIAQTTQSTPIRKVKLKKPKTVRIDEKAPATIPVRVVCPVVKDTWIYAFRPDSNYGGGYGWKDRTDPTKDLTVPKMFLGFGGTDKKLILLDFDISRLPKGVAPKKAVVRLYNDFAGSAASTQVAAKMVLDPWEENKVTWRTAPKLDTAAASTITLRGAIGYKQTGVWYEWDAAGIVSAWMNAGKPCYGIALDPVGDYGVDRDFVCKEYKEKAEFAPMLVVEYDTTALRKAPTGKKESR